MDNFRRSNNYNKDIHGQWRANAGEKVVYTEDFPAPILCVTDDGRGFERHSDLTRFLKFGSTESFRLTDDGRGFERHSDLTRFLKFGSTESSMYITRCT
jgi:hypothetical protein